MVLTEKETTLLKDLKNQEQLCVNKYDRYASQACKGDLKDLFLNLKKTEQQHLNTITEILGGHVPNMNDSNNNNSSQQSDSSDSGNESYNEQEKKLDAYLCSDALVAEKHVSSTYNTSIFEFKDTQIRDTLNQIQKEEQKHGEKIYNYMEQYGMYNQ
jgi:spore coat protein CotF